MDYGTYQIIEVNQDNMIENSIVVAKKFAAERLASSNNIKYIMYTVNLSNDTKHLLWIFILWTDSLLDTCWIRVGYRLIFSCPQYNKKIPEPRRIGDFV